MHIIVVGLNYQTAPVEMREQLAFTEEALPNAMAALKNKKAFLKM